MAVTLTTQRLWRRQRAPRRGPRASLTLDLIVEAAMGIATRDGLESLSMARLAGQLGVSPAALYRHVESKAELQILMADAVTGRLPEPPVDQGWRAGLEFWARAQIGLARSNPWILDLPLATAPSGPHRIRWLDRGFSVMTGLPLTSAEKLSFIGVLSQFVLGVARVDAEIGHAEAERVARGNAEPDAPFRPLMDLAAIVSRYADPNDYPGVGGALADTANDDAGAQAPEGTAAGHDGDDFGLAVILDGLEQYVARRSASRPARRGGDRGGERGDSGL